MNLAETEQVYNHHVKRTEELLQPLNNDSQAINAVITNTYARLFQQHPAFLWFSVGTIVSSKVGENIEFAKKGFATSLGQSNDAKLVWDSLSEGNQKIFKSVLPLFLTYQDVGIEGIKLLTSSEQDNPFQQRKLYDAFKNYALLESRQALIADKLGLPLNDPQVIKQLFSDAENSAMIHSTAMETTTLEQVVGQSMYETEFPQVAGKPFNEFMSSLFKLDEITLLDKSIVFSDYVTNPADIGERLKIAEVLIKAAGDGLKAGQFTQYEADVLKAAEQTLWTGNTHVSNLKTSEVNSAYWGEKAEEYDNKLKKLVDDFLKNNPIAEQNKIANPIDTDEQPLFSSVFNGEHEIVKVNIDPCALFLANNPNYEVIAHDIHELMASTDYFRTPLYQGVALWHPDRPYLQNSTYLAIYDYGEYHYYQPYGEVRGITFPFIYDKTTGIPLTKPIYDDIGHYDHSSTIEAIYNNPEVFNTPSHINWYNPYWNSLVQQAQAQAIQHYLKSISVDSFMNAVVAPPVSYSFEVGTGTHQSQIALKGNDVFHSGASNIDFSSLKEAGSQMGGHAFKLAISSIELANGAVLEVNKGGTFSCMNCNGYHSELLESAANSMLHHLS